LAGMPGNRRQTLIRLLGGVKGLLSSE
jgi:hypothetical protein